MSRILSVHQSINSDNYKYANSLGNIWVINHSLFAAKLVLPANAMECDKSQIQNFKDMHISTFRVFVLKCKVLKLKLTVDG